MRFNHGFLRYYAQVVGVALRHSLDWAQATIFVAVLVLGAASYFFGLPDMTSAATGWQAAALVFGGIIGLRLILAPYWMHCDLRASIPVSPKSDLSMTLREGMPYEAQLKDSVGRQLPDARVWVVKIRNIGDHLLQKCQLTLDDHTVSGHFELRRGEDGDFPVLRIQQRVPDARPIAYFLHPETWAILDGSGWLVNPGIHTVKVLSADSHPALLKVKLSASGVTPPREWKLTSYD